MLNTVGFYQEVLDNLYDGIFFVNNKGLITYWNNGAVKLTGYQHDDVVNRNYCEIFKPLNKFGNDLCVAGNCPIREVLQTEQLMEIDAYVRHRDGHLLPISIRIAPVREVDNQFVIAVEIHNSNSPRYALRQRLEELQEMAMYDALTGISNRRYVEMSLETRLEELKRYQWPFAIMFMDVDNFKHLNDSYGHVVGDRVLKMISSTMVNSLRSFDIIGRWGGEEFVVVLVNVPEGDLFNVCDRFRRLVGNSQLPLEDGGTLSATVSVGASLAVDGDTVDSLIARADRLMYVSKRNGKNRVTIEADLIS